jgi:hypothetical protein
MSQGGFGHHEQIINIMDMLQVKRQDKITNETCGEDGEPPASRANQLSRLSSRLGRLPPSSRLSRVPKSAKPTGPAASPRGAELARKSRLSRSPCRLSRFVLETKLETF